MSTREQYICRADQLRDSGAGIRFSVRSNGVDEPAFAIRYRGRPYAYVNRCAHMQLELDLMPGRFFDNERRYLICATHGAVYEPASGECVLGPCRGGRLTKIQITELAQHLVLTDNAYRLASPISEVSNER